MWDWLLRQAIVNWYLPDKERRSRDLANKFVALRTSLPKLGQAGHDGRLSLQTIRAINSHCGKLEYRSDPLQGFVDLYNHPQFTQYLMDNNKWDEMCDCDDYAVYAIALARECGIAHEKAWLWNLIIRADKQFTEAPYNHVIAGIEYWDGSKIWTLVLDTNTAKKDVFFFLGDRMQTEQAVIEHFAKLYNKTYSILLQVKYPF